LPAIDYLPFRLHDSVGIATNCIFSVSTNFFAINIKDLRILDRAFWYAYIIRTNKEYQAHPDIDQTAYMNA